jgi:hypothetical protein
MLKTVFELTLAPLFKSICDSNAFSITVITLLCPGFNLCRPRWSSGGVLAIAPKILRFKPSRGRWIFVVDKNSNTTSFEGEVKPSVPCLEILRRVKDPYDYERDTS